MPLKCRNLFLFQSHIRVWHGVSLSTYSVVGVGVFANGIISIGFSADVSYASLYYV